jgi:hypothetical protein
MVFVSPTSTLLWPEWVLSGWQSSICDAGDSLEHALKHTADQPMTCSEAEVRLCPQTQQQDR